MPKIEPTTFRIVHLNDATANASSKFLHNKISTAKYSLVTFLFKFFYEQFSKYANLFFLVTVIIQVCAANRQQFREISPTSPYATMIPLAIVLFATAVKEILEDLVAAFNL
jgi:phospholipid-transporting ATPase